MKKTFAVLVVVLFIWGISIPAFAYSRNGDAAVYTDFNAEDQTVSETGGIACESGTLYLNGKGENTTFSIVDKAAKIEMESGGFAVFGQDALQFRDASGNLNYKYLVIRMKGENGNENRTQIGGILLFIGGGDGTHAITLNDRATGSAPAALDANGKPMNAISTEWQEFVIQLTDSNVRKAESGKAITGLNINTVSVPATLYIDDIYLTNSVPETAAVYDPATGTAALTENSDGQTSEVTDNTAHKDTEVEMLKPPVSQSRTASAASFGTGTVMFVISCVVVLIMVVMFTCIYFVFIRKKFK